MPKKLHLAGELLLLCPISAFRAVGEWFDSFGNLLAIFAGVTDEQQTSIILDFIERHALDSVARSAASRRWFAPAIRTGAITTATLNAPHQYHNGGVWPFLGGFYVAALVKAGRIRRRCAPLEKLAVLNQLGHFNEWHHGATGSPMGAEDQAWSAGMYLFADECVRRGQVALP